MTDGDAQDYDAEPGGMTISIRGGPRVTVPDDLSELTDDELVELLGVINSVLSGAKPWLLARDGDIPMNHMYAIGEGIQAPLRYATLSFRVQAEIAHRLADERR